MIKHKYQNLEKDFEEFHRSYERAKIIEQIIFDKWPKSVDAELSLDMSIGSLIRAWIYPEKEFNENILAHAESLAKKLKAHKAGVDIRENEGTFYYSIWAHADHNGELFEFVIFIENFKVPNCELIPVKKEVVVYEKRC